MDRYLDSIESRMGNFYRDFRGASFDGQVGSGQYDSLAGQWYVLRDSEPPAPSPFIGTVKIHCNGTNDLIYADRVEATGNGNRYHRLEAVGPIGFGAGLFWVQGSKHVNLDISYPVESHVLFGIYEDGNKVSEGTEYEVKVYIHYEE